MRHQEPTGAELLLEQLLQDPESAKPTLENAALDVLRHLYRKLDEAVIEYGIAEASQEPADKEGLTRSIIDRVDIFLRALSDDNHGVGEAEKFLNEAGSSETGEGCDFLVRSPTHGDKAPPPVRYWQDAIPDASRRYVPLGTLLKNQSLPTDKKLVEKFRIAIASRLISNPKQPVTLDDGHVTPMNKAFFRACSRTDLHGRQSFYCDDQSMGLLLDATGLYPMLPDEKKAAGWLTVRRMNHQLGRKSYSEYTGELENFLKATKERSLIPIGEAWHDPSTMIATHRSAARVKSEGGMGYSVYCDPALEPYLRENLLCSITDAQAHWLQPKGILKQLHMKSDFNNRYVVCEFLKELHQKDGKLRFTASDGQQVERRTCQCIARVGIRGSAEVWIAHPDLMHQVITREAVEAKKSQVLASASHQAIMQQKRIEGRRPPPGPADPTAGPAKPFDQMLDEYVAGGGNDLIELCERYEAAHRLSHNAMADELGIAEITWRKWRERDLGSGIRPDTIADMVSRFGLNNLQESKLRQLASEEDTTPLGQLIKKTQAELQACSWQDRDKRARIAGKLFDQLVGDYPVQYLVRDLGITPNTVRAWREEIKPEKLALQKMDEVARHPQLVPNPRQAQKIADLLLGLPDRKRAETLLKEFESGKLTLGEALMQKRLQNRHSTRDCGALISVQEDQNNVALVSSLEHNRADHVGIGVARLLADYMEYQEPGPRYRFIRRAMCPTPDRDPDEIMRDFLTEHAAAPDDSQRHQLRRTYLQRLFDNQHIQRPLLLEMVNAHLPDHAQISAGELLYWTSDRPGRKIPPGVFREAVSPVIDIIGLQDEANRKAFIEHFSISHPKRGIDPQEHWTTEQRASGSRSR